MNTDRNGIINLDAAPAFTEYGRYPETPAPKRLTGANMPDTPQAMRAEINKLKVEIEVLTENLRLTGVKYDPNTQLNNLRRGYYKMQARMNAAIKALGDQRANDAALQACENERQALETEAAADRAFIEALAVRLGWGPHVDWEDHETHIMERVKFLLALEARY